MVQRPKENLSAGVGVKAMEIAPFSVFDDLLLFRTYYSRMDFATWVFDPFRVSKAGHPGR
jgi:hypothetical protein